MKFILTPLSPVRCFTFSFGTSSKLKGLKNTRWKEAGNSKGIREIQVWWIFQENVRSGYLAPARFTRTFQSANWKNEDGSKRAAKPAGIISKCVSWLNFSCIAVIRTRADPLVSPLFLVSISWLSWRNALCYGYPLMRGRLISLVFNSFPSFAISLAIGLFKLAFFLSNERWRKTMHALVFLLVHGETKFVIL